MDITDEEQQVLANSGWNEIDGWKRYFYITLVSISLASLIAVISQIILDLDDNQLHLIILTISGSLFLIILGFDYCYMRLYYRFELYRHVSDEVIRRNRTGLAYPNWIDHNSRFKE